MIYTKIHTLEIELSSSCNAGCCVCPRYIQHNNGLYENPHADLNQHLTADIIHDVVTGFPTADNLKVDLIGTVGDPLSNKNIVELIDTIVTHKPECVMQIHTNGSLRNPKTFAQLAELLPYHSQRKIVFSIDGLEDTNHLYRKNVDWNRVMANVEAFISAGGNAMWKIVKFNHNKHQIQEAKKFALNLGFKRFQTSANQSPDELIDRIIIKKENVLTMHKRSPTLADGYEDDDPIESVEPGTIVEPQCEIGQYVHVRADGLVFPCCMVAGSMVDPTEWIRKDSLDLMQLPGDWNNLYKRSFSDIMYSKEWSAIKNNYDSDTPCFVCADNCAVNHDKANKAYHVR